MFCSLLLLSGCEQGEPPVSVDKHAAAGVYTAAISDNGQYALVSSINHDSGFWDLEKNELLFNWKHKNESGVLNADIAPDNSHVITSDKDTFVVWNVSSGESIGYWQAPDSIRAVAISNEGRYVLLGLENGILLHINLKTGRRLEFPGHGENAILAVDMSANGRYVLSGGVDYRALFWDSKTATIIRVWELDSRVNSVSLSQDGQYAFTAGARANAFIWDIQTGAQVSKLALNEREYVISAARISPDNKYVLTGAAGRKLALWSLVSGDKLQQWQVQKRHTWRPSGAIVYAVGFTENARFALSESSAGFGEKWRINN